MKPHEELRALLGKLPNAERAMELLEQATAVPVVWEPDELAKNLAGMITEWVDAGNKTSGEWRDGLQRIIKLRLQRLAPTDSITSARLDELNRLAEIGRRWESDSSLEKWFPYTAEELERLRSRPDELLAAEKRVAELMAFLARFENFDPICGTFNIAPDVQEIHAMAEQCRAALSASKADGCGTSELDLIGGES